MFFVKLQPNGTVKQYNARLVAKGHTQSYGVDYQETFALVAKMNYIHILISIAANQGWSLLQLDIKNVFLRGDLGEEVDMSLPTGF